ncbi:MAG: hypothetical protein ABI859_20080, partial [Pseudomonadota bacterium]
MTTHRKLIQIATVAALIATLPAHAQVLGGALGGNAAGALGGGLGSLHGAGSMSGAGQGAFDSSGAVGGIRNVGERGGSRIRDVAGNASDKARSGTAKVRDAGKKAAETSSAETAPPAASPKLLSGVDGGAATDGSLSGGAQKDVMGRTIAADGATANSASADRSGIDGTTSQQANVKAGRKEAAVA